MSPRPCALLILLALGGCAAMARGSRVQLDAARLARAKQLDVATQSPARWAHHQAAQRAAEASHGEARATATLEAQLWLEAAIAEAEQEEVARARLEEEARLVALDAELLSLQQARLARARENQLRAAREIARGEVDKALARAARKPSQAVKLSRDEARAAAEALSLRAELVAMAISASAPDAAALPRIRAQLRESEAVRARDPDAALTLADQALFRGLASLAELEHGADAAPTDAARAALSESLTSAGFAVARDERGLVATLAPAFHGDALVAAGPRLLERLCALANGYPHGRIALRASSASRVSLLRGALTHGGCPLARVPIAADARAGDVVEAVWLAY